MSKPLEILAAVVFLAAVACYAFAALAIRKIGAVADRFFE